MFGGRLDGAIVQGVEQNHLESYWFHFWPARGVLGITDIGALHKEVYDTFLGRARRRKENVVFNLLAVFFGYLDRKKLPLPEW